MEPGESSPREPNPTVLFRTASGVSAIERRGLQLFADMVAADVAGEQTFTCLVTNDSALRRLNREFLGNDYATDVLSFPTPGDHTLGDLAISWERAAAQAVKCGHSLPDELRILLLHGVLHLLGYDHESDRGEMARAERKWRKHFGLSQTLIARSEERASA